MYKINPKIQDVKTEIKEDNEGKVSSIPKSMDFMLIAENNPFHPERIIPIEEKPKTQPQLPNPEFVLYGTLITDDLKLAYLSDEKASVSTAGRGKRQIPLKVGESLSGFTLKEIEEDKVLMERGEEKLYVYIYDPSKAKSRQIDTPFASKQASIQDKRFVQEPQQSNVAVQQPQPQVTIQPPSIDTTKQPMTPEQARDVFMRLFQQKRQ